MDPHNFIARAEAQRWLGIAEKLLMSHDLVGSKTFAIRARDSDPRLEAADQILAIADTLLGAEKRVVGSNGGQQPDYYAILQLVRFVQETDHIADQYRRLAVILNPNQNRFPYSDQAFQLVNEAWTVLSNPMRKSMYDSELDFAPQQQMNSLGFNLEQQHHHQQHQQQHHQQQQHNFFSVNQELPESPQTFQNRLQQSQQHQQLQQHNFLSQPNPSVREQEHLFQHREQEQLFQPQVQPFQVTSPPHQQTRPSTQPRTPIHSPAPAASQPPFSWQQEHLQQQLQQKQIKQEHQQHQHTKQEQLKQQLRDEQMKQQKLQLEQLKQQRMQEEQLKQQRLQEKQLKQQQLQEEQLKQQRLQEEQLKQQRMHEEQLKQQRIQEEQLKQKMKQEEQLKQQRLQEEQLTQRRMQEEQLKQQQMQQEQLKQQQLQQEQLRQQQLQQEQQQILQEQQKQQHMLQEQQKQQQESLKQNAAPVQLPTQVNSNNGVWEEEKVVEAETEAVDENVDDSPTFWTSCPYCFYMYEYTRIYADCTLRCDNCKRAFQAVRISSPPPIIEGQDAYFCCWGFIPVGVSMSHLQKDNSNSTNSNWTPFSPLSVASKTVHSHLNEFAAPKRNTFVNKSSGSRIYLDNITDDVYVGVYDSRDSSDIEWDSPKKDKLKRMKKFPDPGFKKRIQVLALMALNVRNGSVKNLKHDIPVHEGAGVRVEEIRKKAVVNNTRRQSGRVAKELGKLDLNVEFNNNEGEEPTRGMSTGTRGYGDDDNIEGIGFFEGLDEFLSSLPILSVVNEEKVMVA